MRNVNRHSNGFDIESLRRALEAKVPTPNNDDDNNEDEKNKTGGTSGSRSRVTFGHGGSGEQEEHVEHSSGPQQGRKFDPSIDFRRLGHQLKTTLSSFPKILLNKITNFFLKSSASSTQGNPVQSSGSFVDSRRNSTTSTGSGGNGTSPISANVEASRSRSSSTSSTASTASTSSFDSGYDSDVTDRRGSVTSTDSGGGPVKNYTPEEIEKLAGEVVIALSNGTDLGSEGPKIIFPEKLGGHGDVGFVKGTDVVVKQNVLGPEKKMYQFLGALKPYLQNPESSPHHPPAPLSGCTLGELKLMLENKDLLLSSLPFPIAMNEGSNSTVVAIKNANMLQNSDGSFTKISSEITDIKIGPSIVSKNELKAHYPEKSSGFPWIRKALVTRLVPFMRGTPGRGYEVIPQAKGAKRLMAAKSASDNFPGEINKLTKEQAADLDRKVTELTSAVALLPFTMVGSSILMALPDPKNPSSMPNVMMADFGHAIFESETRDDNSIITEHSYNKYRQNYLEGLNKIKFLVRGVADYKQYVETEN